VFNNQFSFLFFLIPFPLTPKPGGFAPTLIMLFAKNQQVGVFTSSVLLVPLFNQALAHAAPDMEGHAAIIVVALNASALPYLAHIAY
jgi:hypothetical protein